MPPDAGGASGGRVHGHLPGAGIGAVVRTDAGDDGFFVFRFALHGLWRGRVASIVWVGIVLVGNVILGKLVGEV